MKFNKFVWDLYSQSTRGEKALERFSRLNNEFIEPWCRAMQFEFFGEFKEKCGRTKLDIDVPQLVRDAVAHMKFEELKDATRHYKETLISKGIPFEMEDKTGQKQVIFEFPGAKGDWYDYVAAVSLGLYQAQPEYFLSYNFRTKFNQVEEIHAEFNIPLPPVPGKSDKLARCSYYAAINEVWQKFRKRHGLTPVEMCAFLYDFAPQFTTPMDSSDLPTPSKVWLITGGSWDIETAEKATPKTTSMWGGNPAIRRGDILIAVPCQSAQGHRFHLAGLYGRIHRSLLSLSRHSVDLRTNQDGTRKLLRDQSRPIAFRKAGCERQLSGTKRQGSVHSRRIRSHLGDHERQRAGHFSSATNLGFELPAVR